MKVTYGLLALLLLTIGTNAHAQQSTLNAAGGSQDIGNNSYGFSIGEMVLVQTFSSSTAILTQGLLQPSKSPLAISGEAMNGQNLDVYPNPTKNIIYLEPGFSSTGTLSVGLYDALGREISTYTFSDIGENERQQIDCSAIAPGIYIMKVVFQPKNAHARTFQASYKIQRLR